MQETMANFQRPVAPATAGRPAAAASRRRRTPASHAALSVACLAHELTQPLSGILLNASTCLRMLPPPGMNVDNARQAAELIIRDVQRCARVVHALRALFGSGEVACSSVALDEAIRDVLMLSRDDLARGGIEVECEFSGPVPPMATDPVLLQQVLLNLVRNAVEAMRSVAAGRRRLSISARWSEAANEILLGVHDTGPGIASSDADRLFTPFFTTKAEGMGLGLCLARKFAERHRGRIWMARNDGPGTTFWLALPCSREALDDHPGTNATQCPAAPVPLTLSASALP